MNRNELPFDYARCHPSNECKVKRYCARFTSKGREDGTQSNIDGSQFATSKGCAMFINNGLKDE